VLLYGDSYSFRTSASATARGGSDFFITFLNDLAPGRHFSCILDLGCNDLYLLKRLKDRAAARVGVDPIFATKEQQADDEGISVIGATIEEVDLGSRLAAPPDLILCRHTLEHIYEPRLVLEKLFDVATDDSLFVFEVPGFDALVRRLRFDQVFHQHLQYFSLASFRRLLEELGGSYIAHRENYHDWGATLVAFRKDGNRPKTGKPDSCLFDISTIRERYAVFQAQMSVVSDVLQVLGETAVYGYGAAQMLPVLAYHLRNNLTSLKAILDDDPSRDGWYYQNLPTPIRHAGAVKDLESATVLITAVDNVKPILTKLFANRPRHIIFPFNLF
jgi:SAM-dependent methyltransferase